MSITDRVREAVRRPAPAESVVDRVEALRRFLRAVEDHLPEQRLACARTIVDRAGERLSLSREHSVVALAGATGSGKSSLFNALARMELSTVGVRRPTTAHAFACVWGPLGAAPLLDLPDFDSLAAAHRVEVDRLLTLVDLMVWVTDPQKYADQVIHDEYLRAFRR